MGAKTWNPVWDSVFSSRSWGGYPNEDMIRFVARRYGQSPDRGAVSMLDVGSGPGPPPGISPARATTRPPSTARPKESRGSRNG